MIPRPVTAILVTATFFASTLFISDMTIAEQAAPDRQSQGLEAPAPTADQDQQSLGWLADAKADLKLSGQQETLWDPIENAVRNLKDRTRKLRSSFGDTPPNDHIERLRRLGESSIQRGKALSQQGEALTQRGEALTRLADVVAPLWATLSKEQKRSLSDLIGIAAGRGAGDLIMGRARNSNENYSSEVGRRHVGGGWRNDDRHDGKDFRRESRGEYRRYERDDIRGLRDRDNDQRRNGDDAYSRRGQQDDFRPRSRAGDNVGEDRD